MERSDDSDRGLAATSIPINGLANLPTIHMFWHGPAFSRIEKLCVASFVANGHQLQLHVYEEPVGTPAGITIADARKVIDESKLFRHPKSGSMAQFADWFRYRVLYESGGIWADTDVVCLQPLRYSQAEIYAWQDELQINNAVLGLPARHPLAKWMADCCENPNKILPYDDGRSKRRKWRRRWLQGNRRGNVKWGEYGPVGFTSAARHLNYADKALPAAHFYPVHYRDWQMVFDQPRDLALLGEARALHLWNEMLRRHPGFDKNARFLKGTLIEQLCDRYLDE
jgi:hypothetical protein